MSISDKGKQKVVDTSSSDYSDSSDASDPETESEAESSSESDEEITQEYLDMLLQRARQSAAAAEAEQIPSQEDNEEILTLDDVEHLPLPKLNPGILPASYIQLGKGRGRGGTLVRDPETEEAEKKSEQQQTTVAPPLPPTELTKSGKPLTKKEKKESKKQTAGPDWFDMPAPAESDLPRLNREYEAMRLRNQLDPKRFYRKDEGEGKGTKGLPKYFAIGKIVATDSPFGNPTSDNLPRSQRKRTLVDELIDDAEAKRYAKKKFNELQSVRVARGKNTLRIKQALRKPKW